MENWQFENIDYLWALTGIPVLMLLFWARNLYKRKLLKRLGTPQLREKLLKDHSKGRPIWKNAFLILAMVSLIIGMANPQTDGITSKVKIKGSEIIIAVDVSNSMKAEDLSPNRLEKAKVDIIQLLNRVKNDRVGLIIFAGKAFIPVPLTTDYAMVKMYLRGIDTDVISTQGTDVAAAISLAQESFSEDKKRNKAIILITDGEDHEENAVETARKASEEGIVIHTIGMGNKEGVPLPARSRYGKKEFRRDKEGNVVVSKLNEGLLNEIASIGKGSYIHASNYGLGLDRVYEQLSKMEKAEFQEKIVTDYEDNFQLYLWIALTLLLIELVILPKKNKLFERFRLANAKI